MSLRITKAVNNLKKDDQIMAVEISNRTNKAIGYLIASTEPKHGKSFVETQNKLIPILTKNGINCVFCVAPRKSGKTTLIKNMLQFSNKPVLLFSRLEKDEAIDDLPNLHRVVCDETMLEDKDDINLEEIQDTIPVFDDVEFENAKLQKLIDNLADRVLSVGRHTNNLYCIRTAHLLLNNNRSKQALNESDTVILFLNTSNRGQCISFMKKYVGMNNEQINDIFAMSKNLRWTSFYRNSPNVVFNERYATLL